MRPLSQPADPLDDDEPVLFEGEERLVRLEPAAAGERLDKALAACVQEFSRNYLQQLTEQGQVTVNAKVVCKPSLRVKAGDTLTLELRPTPQSQAFRPQAIEFGVVYEDAHILVVNKPAGLVVHPAPGNWSGTLLNGLLAHHACFSLVPRAGIVHRLDKDTSGLMVVARQREVMDSLVQAIAERRVSRQYLALGHAAWGAPACASVDAPIGRDPRNRLRMAVVDLAQHAGKQAKTDFQLLDSAQDSCLVRCILHTGRTHQIRVHMAYLGHPLLADALYGGKPLAGMQRQALHAARLAFAHPVDARPMVFEAPMPQDMVQGLEQCGLRYNPAKA